MEGMLGGLAWRERSGTQCRRVPFQRLMSPQRSIKGAVYMTLAFREHWEEFLWSCFSRDILNLVYTNRDDSIEKNGVEERKAEGWSKTDRTNDTFVSKKCSSFFSI